MLDHLLVEYTPDYRQVCLYAEVQHQNADMTAKTQRRSQLARPHFTSVCLFAHAETRHEVRAFLNHFSQCLSPVGYFVVSGFVCPILVRLLQIG